MCISAGQERTHQQTGPLGASHVGGGWRLQKFEKFGMFVLLLRGSITFLYLEGFFVFVFLV